MPVPPAANDPRRRPADELALDDGTPEDRTSDDRIPEGRTLQDRTLQDRTQQERIQRERAHRNQAQRDLSGHRALLILLLLAREADLAPEQVVSAAARALVVRGLARSAARRHRSTSRAHGGRTWMCRHRWTA